MVMIMMLFHAPVNYVYSATATDHDAVPNAVDADDEDLAGLTDNGDDAAVDGDDPRRE
jgi:hypothetical protein